MRATQALTSLISEGYSVISIHPILKTVIAADGTLTTKATTATLTMTKPTTETATINTDTTNAKATHIQTKIRTTIDKNNS